MTRESFRKLIESKIVLLDGATGSNLMKAGMPSGVCPEQWILEHSEVLVELQKSYLQQGTDILYAPTFSGNRFKLEEYGLAEKQTEINTQLVQLSKRAIEEFSQQEGQYTRNCYIAGDMTMTGRNLAPLGTLSFEELVEVYKEQARILAKAGVDLFVVETMMSLQECRAAVLAIRETTDLPVMVTLTFTEEGKTLYGTEPETAVLVLQGLGADAVGVNCSTGPKQMESIVSCMKSVANVPIIAKPNAGLPQFVNGETVYDTTPMEFAKGVKRLVEAGASIVGGCCGTTPEHISLLAKEVSNLEIPKISNKQISAVTNERVYQSISLTGEFVLIGERINPTGKKALQAELREGKTDLVLQYAEEQEMAGAKLLDINVGMSGIDEKEMLCKVISEVTQTVNLPLCIDTSSVEAMEAGLRIYPGRALLNSISLEQGKLEPMLELAKKYGAMFIVLPLSSKGLPTSLEEKHSFIEKIIQKAEEIGLCKESVLVDALVTTVGANPQAAKEVLATIAYCTEILKVPTSCGLSNISFGLPERSYLNVTFLTMAMAKGLSAAIANPSASLIQESLVSAELLLAKENAVNQYVACMAEKKQKKELQATSISTEKSKNMENTNTFTQVGNKTDSSSSMSSDITKKIYQAILKGNKKQIAEWTKEALEAGEQAEELLKQVLMPAIQEVGTLFETKRYFLPQLMQSAEAMKLAVEVLEPVLESDGSREKLGTVVIATVEGDIHDIGKNLVSLMLKNYGFLVYDLGKDISAEVIVEKAKETKADIIALSALMTTTMQEMKKVVALRNQEQLSMKIMIGGAVITEEYAREIGADGYSKDAQEAVEVAKKLL